jgi:uncharacterized protein YkwD
VRRRIGLLALLTAASLAGSGALTNAPAEASSDRQARLVARINDARAVHGLPALAVSERLTTYARKHSVAMWRQRQLFHTSDFGVICCWSLIGENVAVGFGTGQVHRGLMASPPHRSNILHPAMRAVGVGAVKRDGRIWVTQVFTRPR